MDIGNKTSQVNVVTLNGSLPLHNKYFLKIDVEGFGHYLIEGASEVLPSGSISAIIIELNSNGTQYGYSKQEVHNKIVGYSYLPVSYDPFNRSIHKLDSYNASRGNTIYVKSFELMLSRCKLAPKRKIHTTFDIEL